MTQQLDGLRGELSTETERRAQAEQRAEEVSRVGWECRKPKHFLYCTKNGSELVLRAALEQSCARALLVVPDYTTPR